MKISDRFEPPVPYPKSSNTNGVMAQKNDIVQNIKTDVMNMLILFIVMPNGGI